MQIFGDTDFKNRSIILDLLRIFACVWVCTYHWYGGSGEWLYVYKYPFPRLHWPIIDGIVRFGFIGVDIFFIISGCVIARTVLGRDSLKFLEARFWRLFPSIFIVSLVTMGIRLIQTNQSFGQQKYNLFQGIMHSTGIPILASISGGYHVFWIGDNWTLPIEVLFYFILATIIILFGKLDRKSLTTFATIAALMLFFLRNNLVEGFSIYFVFGILLYCVTSWRSLLRLFPVLFVAGYLLENEIYNRIQFRLIDGGHSRIFAEICAIGFVLGVGSVLLVRDYIVLKSEKKTNSIRMLSLMTFPFYLLHESFGLQFVNLLFRHSLDFRVSFFVTFVILLIMSWVLVKYLEPAMRSIGSQFMKRVLLDR